MSNDTSMFVATAARLFIARYLISSCSCHNYNTTTISLQPVSWLLDILQQKLSVNSEDSSESSKEKIAVLDVIRMLICKNVNIGQEIIGSSKLLVKSIDLVEMADEKVCAKLVEVISEILENFR